MPQYLTPGVYVEEVPSGSSPIAGASTSTPGIVGYVADDVVMPFKPGQLVQATAADGTPRMGAAGKPVIDSPYADLGDIAGAAEEDRRARGLGFAGKAAIHPKMIPDIRTAFTPSAAQISEAELIVSAFEASGGAVARIGGKLVELPVVLRMRRLLERAAPH